MLMTESKNGINLRNRNPLLTFPALIHNLWYASAKRRMECCLASHPRGLLLADFPNNFGSVSSASGVLRVVTTASRRTPSNVGDRLRGLVDHYCEVMQR